MRNKKIAKDSLRPGEIIEQYKYSLEAANRSQKTISWYLDILYRYFNYIETYEHNKPIDELGRHELESYIKHLQNSTRWSNSPNNRHDKGNLSPFSIQGHVRAIKAFWS